MEGTSNQVGMDKTGFRPTNQSPPPFFISLFISSALFGNIILHFIFA
jgi:hypothetical protein